MCMQMAEPMDADDEGAAAAEGAAAMDDDEMGHDEHSDAMVVDDGDAAGEFMMQTNVVSSDYDGDPFFNDQLTGTSEVGEALDFLDDGAQAGPGGKQAGGEEAGGEEADGEESDDEEADGEDDTYVDEPEESEN